MAEQESQSKVLSEGISELLNRLREQQNSSGSIEIENLLYESLSNSENGEVPMLFRELESMVAASTSNNTVDDISNIVSTLLSNINNAPPAVPVTGLNFASYLTDSMISLHLCFVYYTIHIPQIKPTLYCNRRRHHGSATCSICFNWRRRFQLARLGWSLPCKSISSHPCSSGGVEVQ